MILDDLYKTIESRKKDLPNKSYTSTLFKKGINAISQKVGEEAVEVVIASKNGKKKEIIYEMADLWFHTLVLLSFFDIKPKDIFDELEKRKTK